MKSKTARGLVLQARIRVRVGDEIALGPGKVELLELVHQTGSIVKAAKRMGVSYMRAWTLIRTMNACFKEPLVIAARGGRKGGGGAKLTDLGDRVLGLYHDMDLESFKAIQPFWKQLRLLLRR
jgi:molybdate transport system regulatory protein